MKWKSTYSPKVFSQPPPFRMPTRTTIKLQKSIIVMIVIIIIINYTDPDQHWAAEIKEIISINHFYHCQNNQHVAGIGHLIQWLINITIINTIYCTIVIREIVQLYNCMKKVKNNCWRQTAIHWQDYETIVSGLLLVLLWINNI